MTPASLDLDDLRNAMATSIGHRTPLMVWMITYHDEFAELVTIHRPDWAALSAYFANAGFKARDGAVLKPETTRTYWLRARRLVAKQRTTARRAAFKFPPPAQPTPAPSAAPTDNTEPKFKFAKLRNGGLGVSAEELRALGDPSAPADPNDPRWRLPPGTKTGHP